MKRNIFITVMGFLSLLFGTHSDAQLPAPQGNRTSAGRGLRLMMLTTPPARTGERPTEKFPRVYGVLMDWPVRDQTATIFSSSSGAASLYTTSAFGIIGGEGHESVRIAAINFVRAADRLFSSAMPTTEYPYPDTDHVRFYLLTFDGVRVLETDLASISTRTSKYTEFFDLGQAVVTELRLVTEKRK
jgi:hypothetical protein